MAVKGKMLAGAPKKQGRWARRPPPRQRQSDHRGAALLLLGLGFLILGGVVGFGWALDRQLRGGILEQRREAMRRPDWVPIDRIPPALPRMVAAVVDPDIYERRPFESQTESPTLSRDLVHQVHLLRDGLGAQARGLLMAPLLESHLSRRALLELYLNRVYFGKADGMEVFGVHNAAREFFGKEPRALTLGESATLAGLLLEPRLREPERTPGAVGARRNEVLRTMLEAGVISERAYRAAVAEPLAFQPGVEWVPMTRPLGGEEEPPVMRLPAPSSPEEASPAAGGGA